MESNYVLVTGAAGFIGSRLTQTLLDQDRKVIALDCFLPDLYPADLKRDRWDNLKAKKKSSLVKLEFDLRIDDLSKLDDYPIDSIFNQAAMPGLVSDWGKFTPYYDCNISALNRLLEYAKQLPLKSFIQASTSSVYGKNAVGDEKQNVRPTSPYGVSKLAAESLLLAYLDWHEVPVRILRYFSVYGPNQRPDMAYAKIIQALLSGKEFVVYGDGEQKRSNTYIDDIVDATIRAESRAQNGDIMNICGDQTFSLNQIILLLESLSEKKLNKINSTGRLGDQRDTSGLNAIAKSRLGWTANTPIELGLRHQLDTAISSYPNS